MTVTFSDSPFVLGILDYQITETPLISVDEESQKLIYREVINLTLYCGEEPA